MRLQKKMLLLALVLTLMACGTKSSQSKWGEEQDTLPPTVTKEMERESTTDNNAIADIVQPHGTQLLPQSVSTYYTMEITSLSLQTIAFTDCVESIYAPGNGSKNHELLNVNCTDSTLSINFSVLDKCGSDFLCEVEFVEPNTLNLVYHTYGSLAYCDCCYSLTYNFWNLAYDQHEYEDHPRLKFITFNGQHKIRVPELDELN